MEEVVFSLQLTACYSGEHMRSCTVQKLEVVMLVTGCLDKGD